MCWDGYNLKDIGNKATLEEASNKLLKHMVLDWINHGRLKRERLYICIGTPLVTGDAFGPMVGNLLIANNIENVVGTVKEPIHWGNLMDYNDLLNSDKYFKIGIDVAVNDTDCSYLKISDTPFEPGSGVGKNSIKIGDISCIYSVGMKGTDGNVGDMLRESGFDELTAYSVFLGHAILKAEQMMRKIEERERKR